MATQILRRRSILVLVALVVWIVALAPTAFAAESTDTVRLMVKLDPSVVSAAGMMPNAVATDNLGLGWTVIEVPAGQEAEALAQLQADPTVLDATPDYPLEATFTPDDPAFANDGLWNLNQIGADLAWEFSRGTDVVVAVVDSGVDASHPDLRDRLVPGYNFQDDNTDTTDRCGHGTHVAGIVAAAGNNGIGGVGVAFAAKIMPIKVMADDCSGTYSRLMKGILYALDNGADVIVITSGGSYDHQGLHEAVQTARERGVMVVVAAGNRANDAPFYPGSYAESFTVAGTSTDDAMYANSTFGTQIDISAPATHIYSTYLTQNGEANYIYMTGTSMAAPHVAGLAALILAMDPELPLADLEAVITQTADDLGEPGKDVHFGYGRINAWRAVWAVSPAVGNLRPGHARIPSMGELGLQAMNAAATNVGISLEWQLTTAKTNATVVVYRSVKPLMESAVDVAELPAINADGQLTGSFVDTDVTPETTYYYWLVFADRSVEMAASPMQTVTATVPQPEVTEPAAGTVLLLPFVQTVGS